MPARRVAVVTISNSGGRMTGCTPLNETQKEQVRLFRDEFRVFQDVTPHLLHPTESRGVTLAFCGDCDQAEDMVGFHERLQIQISGRSRVHRVALNGGAILIPPASPASLQNDGQVMLAHIKFAVEKKGTDTVALHIHAPCGMAGHSGLTIPDTVGLLVQAKMIVRESCPGTRVVCFAHVDKGTLGKRTYFVSPQKWTELQKNGAPEALFSRFFSPMTPVISVPGHHLRHGSDLVVSP